MVLILSTVAHAQVTYFVPGDYATIQDALNAALDGDTILVQAGSYHEAVVFNGHDVTLIGIDGSDVTAIEPDNPPGGTGFRVLLGETVTIQGFQFFMTNGMGVEIDGGSTVTLIDCAIGAGGSVPSIGVKMQSSSVTMIDCSVLRATSIGIQAQDGVLIMEDCYIETNAGGAPSSVLSTNSGVQLDATRCTFNGNGAAEWAAVLQGSGDRVFTDCLVTGGNTGVLVSTGTVSYGS